MKSLIAQSVLVDQQFGFKDIFEVFGQNFWIVKTPSVPFFFTKNNILELVVSTQKSVRKHFGKYFAQGGPFFKPFFAL